MKTIWFFDFEARRWTSKQTTGGRDNWTFGHAIRRSRYMYAYGTHHAVHTEESLAEASAFSAALVIQYPFLDTVACQQKDVPWLAILCAILLEHCRHHARFCEVLTDMAGCLLFNTCSG